MNTKKIFTGIAILGCFSIASAQQNLTAKDLTSTAKEISKGSSYYQDFSRCVSGIPYSDLEKYEKNLKILKNNTEYQEQICSKNPETHDECMYGMFSIHNETKGLLNALKQLQDNHSEALCYIVQSGAAYTKGYAQQFLKN